MHMGIDQTRQDCFTFGVDRLSGIELSLATRNALDAFPGDSDGGTIIDGSLPIDHTAIGDYEIRRFRWRLRSDQYSR